MLAIAAIAVNLPRAMAGHGGTIGFAVRYVVLRALLIALYGRAWRHVHRRCPQALRGLHRRLLVDDGALARVDLHPRPVSLRALGRGDGDRPRHPDTGVADPPRRVGGHLAPHRAVRHVLHHRPRRIRGRGGGGRGGIRVHGRVVDRRRSLLRGRAEPVVDLLRPRRHVGRRARRPRPDLRLCPLPCWAEWRPSARAPSSRSWMPPGRASVRVRAGRWRAGSRHSRCRWRCIHLGAEWTSLRDRTFLGRIVLARVASRSPRPAAGRHRSPSPGS